jgi:hypothetical protein
LNGRLDVPLFRIFLAATLAASVGGVRSHAQSAPSTESSQAESTPANLLDRIEGGSSPAPLGAVGPDVFFLPDASGKLRRVLGYRYEDFLETWRAGQGEQQAVRPPAYALSRVVVDAAAEGDEVEATVVVEIEIQSNGWIEVPLQLGTLVVERSEFDGKDERDFLLFDPQQQGFVAWVYGTPGEQRRLTLSGQLLVQRDGASRQLEFELPTAASSHVDFTAASQVEVETPKAAVHSTVTADDGRYTSQIEGAKGRLALRWGPRSANEFDRTATLSSTVDVSVTVDPGRVAYDAQVTLQSFGEPLERVRLRLPRGAVAAALPTGAGYELIPISSAAGRDGTSLIEVRFDRPSTPPPAVRLVAEQSGGPDGTASIEAAPFEVVGAFRQRSQIAVRVSDQLHADFQRHGRLLQIDSQELPEPMRTPAPLAAFAGAGADWRLEIATQPRQRKVRVTPTYALHLGAQGATLEATLDYQFLGGRTFELRADLRGWELAETPVESGGVVDLAEQHVTPAGVLVMPLKESDLQQARVRITLRREAGLGLHDLPLPEILDASSLPGGLTVSCDDAWRTTVDVQNSSGIASADGASRNAEAPSAVAAAPAEASPPAGRTRRPNALSRYQTFLARARVVVDVNEQDQAINVASLINGAFVDGRLELDQQLQYDISYQPATEISATVAADLLANEGLQLLLDGKPLTSSAIEILPLGAAPNGANDGNLRLQVRLPRPTVGRLTLQIRTAHKLSESQLNGRSKIAVPLAAPPQSTASQAQIVPPSATAKIALWGDDPSEPWRTVAPAAVGVGGEQTPTTFNAAASKPVSELALRLDSSNVGEESDLQVVAAWVQTWIVGGQRQDRYVYRFRTRRATVEVRLPSEFNGRPLEVKLDGNPTSVSVADGLLTVPLRSDDDLHEYTLELRRHAPQQLPRAGSIGASFPRLQQARVNAPFYWQLIVPRDMAVASAPEGMNGEYRLGWREWSWGRQPTQSQADLERWTSATSAPELPASTNQYLYSAFETPTAASAQVMRRAWLIIGAAIGALGVGLIALYTNLGRTAGFWLAAIVAAAAALAAYPEAAVLLVQAIFLGGAFTIVSLATRWLLADVRIRRHAPPAPASSIASLTATQPWLGDRGERTEDSDGVMLTAGSTRNLREPAP